jgi:hypothetical protein
MQGRQTYRTMARMQRRRSWIQDRVAAQDEPEAPPPAAAPAPAQPAYVAELQQLAQLRDSGVITSADFEAKKQQLLGVEL